VRKASQKRCKYKTHIHTDTGTQEVSKLLYVDREKNSASRHTEIYVSINKSTQTQHTHTQQRRAACCCYTDMVMVQEEIPTSTENPGMQVGGGGSGLLIDTCRKRETR
jgi:hypothetical protein